MGKLKSFDKLEDIKNLINKTLKPCVSRKIGYPSIRKIITFHQYIRNRLTAGLRLTPLPVSHIYDAACACISKKFAKEIARQFLRYPHRKPKNIQNYIVKEEGTTIMWTNAFNIPDLSEHIFFYTGSKKYSFEKFNESCSEAKNKIEIVQKAYPFLSKKELKVLGGNNSTRWEIEEDYRLHELACSKVREIASKRQFHRVVKRSWGTIGEGIHWKSTITSKARGEDIVYIKLKRHSRKEKKDRFNEFTPIVFIFSDDFSNDWSKCVHDSNITQRNYELGNLTPSSYDNPPPDLVYSVFFTSSRRESLYKGHIEKEYVSSIAFLYTSHIMGLERYAKITKRLARFQCRSEPIYDNLIGAFPLSESGVAWAIKYAENTVLVVSKDGWKPSEELLEFAKAKDIRIKSFSLSNFTNDFIERLRTLHFTSTALKKRPDRSKIVRRFIE
jgi:hypothetical protein